MDENLSKSDLTLFRKVLLIVVGTVMILISLFLIISMKTLNLSETGWNTLSSEPSTNFFGVFGAHISPCRICRKFHITPGLPRDFS